MIDKLRAMAIFAAVVDQGTFRSAAQHLGLAPSRISQTVSDLERELGVTLLYRSTRRLSLTHEGKILYDNVSQMLQAAESGLDAINFIASDPAGDLRITAPAFATQTGLMDSFSEFYKLYPQVTLKVNFSDQPRDLIREGFDVAIRAGWLKDSELMARNIGQARRLLVASPNYIAEKKPIDHPSHLEQWDWIHFSMRSDRTELIAPDGNHLSVLCKNRLEVDSAYAMHEFALRGLGVTMVPEHFARKAINAGELVHLFPEYKLKPLELYAVWPDRSRRENLTLIFVRFLAEHSASL